MEKQSFEELGKAFARVMRGEALEGEEHASSLENAPSEFHGSDLLAGEECVDIPEGLNDEDDAAFDLDEEDDDAFGSDSGEDDAFSGFTESPLQTEFDDDGVVPISPSSVLEAMLFVGNPQNRPLRPETASELMRGVSVEEVRDLVRQLNLRYEAERCPWLIVYDSREDGYSMQLRDAFMPLREVFYGKIRQAKLSQSAIDVLAIVAYEQPLTLDDLNKLRGVHSAPILGQLLRRKLLRAQKARRGTKFITEYYTTERFLKLFELESLADLPQSQNLDRE